MCRARTFVSVQKALKSTAYQQVQNQSVTIAVAIPLTASVREMSTDFCDRLRRLRLKYLFALCLMLAILCTTRIAFAQSTDASISGVVFDPSGKVIPDADIEILNEATGLHYSGKTNGAGIYTVSILPPGQYRVQVSKAAFKTIIKPGIILNVQSALALNFTLPIGAASETVTVDSGTSLINTTDGAVSTVIDRKFVENIPLNGRSFQDLISMTPGVVTQSPQSGGSATVSGDFSVNGQRTESNSYLVDGVSGNLSAGNGYGTQTAATSGSVPSSTALGTTQSLISVDALQEFRVESSSYSAEYGRSPGGQFSLVTRSGTNEVHGTAYDYLRNNFFDANDWFNDLYGAPQAALRQNDFGATLGGPLIVPHVYNGRGRSFLFMSYEGLRLTQPQAASINYVPDSYMRDQAPSALQPILNAFPIATGLDYGSEADPGLAQFIKAYSVPSQIDSGSIRIDHNITPKLALFFRYGITPSSTEARSLSEVARQQIRTRTYTFGATSHLSTRMDNELRLGYGQSKSSQIGSIDSFGSSTPVNLADQLGLGGYANPSPYFGIFVTGVGSAVFNVSNADSSLHQWNLVDSMSYLIGSHHLKIGVDYRRIVAPTNPPATSPAAEFFSTNSVLNNSVDYLFLEKQVSATPIFSETSLFAQDEWRVSSTVNLSLGLRWDRDPPPGEAHGQEAYTVQGNFSDPSSLKLAPRGTALWRTTWLNLAPRLGLAWTARATPGWETVVRSGGGVFYDTDAQVASMGFEGIGFAGYASYSGVPLPITSSQMDFPTGVTGSPYTGATIYAFPSHLQLPYTLQWNASVEQAFHKDQALTMTYVGSNGRRLIGERAYSLTSLNADFGTVVQFPANLTSNYQALQVQFQRTLAQGLQALTSYTWSHCLDFGSNYQALPLIRGNSDFDVRHSFTGGISWDLPAMRNGMLTGWGFDGRIVARSSFPVTLQGNFLSDPASGSVYFGNLNIVPNQPIYLYGSQYPGGRAINPAAFSSPGGNNAGDAPRNFARGFGEAQINVAARRQFPLHDQLKLQFRAETFNLLNHPNFGYVDPYLTDATFGEATQMLNQSLGTLASQYQQGGPRSMQFALKLIY
jgi:hypothetical protein